MKAKFTPTIVINAACVPFLNASRALVRAALKSLALKKKAVCSNSKIRWIWSLLDAPCTGVGAWRRKPDSKWRLSPATLEQRIKDQKAVLESGANLTKPGGRLVYITCSLLPEENTDQVAFFLKHHKNFKLIPYPTMWKIAFDTPVPPSADGNEVTLTMSPHSHDTDGFFIAIMEKSYAKAKSWNRLTLVRSTASFFTT